MGVPIPGQAEQTERRLNEELLTKYRPKGERTRGRQLNPPVRKLQPTAGRNGVRKLYEDLGQTANGTGSGLGIAVEQQDQRCRGPCDAQVICRAKSNVAIQRDQLDMGEFAADHFGAAVF